ncbi:transcription initiation factor TFIID subunit 13 isoform X3 [Quercus suber]|uniref:transcription initiation factor TFIID subunit 13 isoform X3 n=1 Tax=Quercus suber TaxID=58331 RepID=UPI0032DE69AF
MVIFATKILICLLLRVGLLILESSLPQQMARIMIILISQSKLHKPLPESVALVEDIAMEYITDLVHKAQDIGSKRGKLSVEDFLYLIRKDLPKLNRCTELLSMNKELKQARKVFESDEEKLRKVFEADEEN